MIRIQFHEPNFRAKVIERNRQGAQPHFRLLYAENMESAKQHLEALKLEVLDLKPYDFEVWKQKAKDAKDDVLKKYPEARARGEKYEFKSALWGELKEHLQSLFRGRCAYCEAWFLSVSFGDVEHYRPKAEVSDDPNHPGYYWLAYEPTNYLPSCMRCNQEAKRNFFPVKGRRASGPDDNLTKEDPLLINSYLENHFEHIAYNPARGKNGIENTGGIAVGKSEKGKISIETYNLNREWLVRDRKKTQTAIRAMVKEALTSEDVKRLNEILTRCLAGEEEYCTAAATEIAHYYKTMGLGSPFPVNGQLGS